MPTKGGKHEHNHTRVYLVCRNAESTTGKIIPGQKCHSNEAFGSFPGAENFCNKIKGKRRDK